MPADRDDYNRHDKGWLIDRLRQRDRDLIELRRERDEQTSLIQRLREHAEDYNNALESWRETFDMQLTDKGWSWMPFWDEHNKLVEDWNHLVRRWNKYVPMLNQSTQPVGRPLAASDAQIATVTKLHKDGMSLRGIADDTSLSLRTVRTIIGQINGTDRATQKRRHRLGLEPIRIDKRERARWKRQKRDGDALPKRVNAVIETGKALITESRGLGRRR